MTDFIDKDHNWVKAQYVRCVPSWSLFSPAHKLMELSSSLRQKDNGIFGLTTGDYSQADNYFLCRLPHCRSTIIYILKLLSGYGRLATLFIMSLVSAVFEFIPLSWRIYEWAPRSRSNDNESLPKMIFKGCKLRIGVNRQLCNANSYPASLVCHKLTTRT